MLWPRAGHGKSSGFCDLVIGFIGIGEVDELEGSGVRLEAEGRKSEE